MVERIEALERGQRAIALEWEETYDNIRRVLAKLSKRDKRAEGPLAEPELENGTHRVAPSARPLDAAERFRLNNLRR